MTLVRDLRRHYGQIGITSCAETRRFITLHLDVDQSSKALASVTALTVACRCPSL